MASKLAVTLKIAGILSLILALICTPWYAERFAYEGSLLCAHDHFHWFLVSFFGLVSVVLLLHPFLSLNWILSLIPIYGLLAGFEFLLFSKPELAGIDFANAKLFHYDTGPDGIYFVPRNTSHIHWMKPNFETKMFMNGYYWNHKTDKHGFRNAVDKQRAELMFIGDSFIYGHGVEAEETVSHQLELMSGRSCFNLGQQGAYIFTELSHFSAYGLLLQPKTVFYFFFENDLTDVEQQDDFWIDQVVEEGFRAKHLVRFPMGFLSEQFPPPEPAIDRYLKTGLLAIELLKYRKQHGFPQNTAPSLDEFEKRSKLRGGFLRGAQIAQKRRTLKYTLRGVNHLKKLCDRSKARLVMVPIVFNQHADLNDSLQTYAAEKSIDFINLKDFMLVEEHFLPNDLHFSPRGHKNLAEILKNWLEANPIEEKTAVTPLDS